MGKELIDYIEELEVKCTEEYNIIKAKAYNVRIEDNYAIQLRDEFNKNAGKYEIVAQIKRKNIRFIRERSRRMKIEEYTQDLIKANLVVKE